MSPFVPIANPLHFTGATRQLRGRHWLSGEAMYRYAETLKTPYLGSPPRELRKALGLDNPLPLYRALDELRREISRSPHLLPKFFTLELPGAKNPARLTYLNHGTFGNVYKLQVGDYACAVKFFKQAEDPAKSQFKDLCTITGGHGNAAESATAIYLSQWRFGDQVHCYVANPLDGWMITELLSKESRLAERSKLRLRDKGAIATDFGGDKPKEFDGISTDFGFIRPTVSLEELAQAELPEQMILFQRLRHEDMPKALGIIRKSIEQSDNKPPGLAYIMDQIPERFKADIETADGQLFVNA